MRSKMLDLSDAILSTFSLFSPLFSRPIDRNVRLLFLGHILCKGRRTIADVLRCLHLENIKNFSKFHWVLSGAKWCAFQGAKILLLEIARSFSGSEEELLISIDTTIERRKGCKIKGLGRQRDAVRSTKGHKVLTTGLQWLVASVCVKIPMFNRFWALPFFTQLVPPKRPLSSSKNTGDLKGRRHKKSTEWAAQLPLVIRYWLGKERKFAVVADQGFACYKIAHACVKAQSALISRLRFDARIFDFPPREILRRGRPRLVGKRLPLFTELLKDKTLTWEELEVDWYESKKKRVLIYTGTSLWYAYGIPPVTIRWVLLKDPSEEVAPVVLFSTNIEHSPTKIIEAFVLRWRLEVTFEESRRHLGVETQRQWADAAIERTTPCLMGSFSIITLMAVKLAQEERRQIPIQNTSWYKKDHVTFSDVLSYVRTHILRRRYFSKIGKKIKLGKIDLEELISRAAAA
ncbi:MAG: transposase [Chlamydiales bacterium]